MIKGIPGVTLALSQCLHTGKQKGCIYTWRRTGAALQQSETEQQRYTHVATFLLQTWHFDASASATRHFGKLLFDTSVPWIGLLKHSGDELSSLTTVLR